MKLVKYISANMSIKYKIFISYCIILTLTLCLVFSMNTFFTTKEINQRTLFNMEKNLNQTKSLLEFKTHSTKNIMDITAINSTLQQILERPVTDYDDDVGLFAIDALNLRKVFFTTTTNPDILSIQIYMKEGPATLFQNEDIKDMADYEESNWYKSVDTTSNRIKWLTSEDFDESSEVPSIVAIKKIPSTANIYKSIGMIRVNMPRSLIQQNLDESIMTESAVALLVNDKKVIATSTNKASQTLEVMDMVEALKAKEELPYVGMQIMDKQSYIVGVDAIHYSDWRLVLIVPNKDIKDIEGRALKQFILFNLIVIPLTFPIAYWISKSITKRITVLIRNIRNVERERFDDEIAISSRDEVGILTQNFNHMMLRISMLLDEKYALGQEIMNMELKALHSQINPHFLYNTLDQIYWMGIRYQVPDISNLVLELSKFYRLSLNKGEDVVTLASELEHIKAYMYIQNIRFGETIELSINIQDECKDILLPKITLQPMVENAILHGILEKDSGEGHIIIEAHEGEEDIEIHIKDDGVGMSLEKLEALNHPIETKEGTGYGLKNIRSRLQILYQGKSDLKVKLNQLGGVDATIIIPRVKNCKP